MHSFETGTYTAVLTGFFVLMLFITYFLVTIIRYQRERITPHNERLHFEIKSVEEERQRIARDLHAALYAVKLKLHAMEPGTDAEKLLVTQSGKYLDEAFATLKAISLNLTPQVLQKKGLPVALDELLHRLLAPPGITFSSNYSINLYNQDAGIHIYRIVQEIVTNIVKHAAATMVSVNLEMKDHKHISLHIRDNGTGFNKRTVLKNNTGRGLQNIMARIHILNATMYLATDPGKGTDYLINIPFTHDVN